jgi:type IV pilus assembly protein PilM
MISRYSSVVRAAGLRPLGVDVKALSLLRSTLPTSFFGDEGAILLLDVGTEISNLVVSQGGNPTLTRFFPGGSSHLARAVAEAADLSEEEAEKQLMNPKVRIGPDADKIEDEEEAEGSEDEDFDPALLYDFRRGLWKTQYRPWPRTCSGPSSTTTRSLAHERLRRSLSRVRERS